MIAGKHVDYLLVELCHLCARTSKAFYCAGTISRCAAHSRPPAIRPDSAAAIGAAKLMMQVAVVDRFASEQKRVSVELRAGNAVLEAVPVPAGAAFLLVVMVASYACAVGLRAAFKPSVQIR